MSHIPLLLNHDAERVIGTWRPDGIGEFAPGQNITRDQLFEIFGGAGIRFLEYDVEAGGILYVRRFQILEFSLCPG